jgi:hypothetical protein
MSTFFELTNLLLRRLLETELTTSNFVSARSTQNTAKDCVRDAVDEILTRDKRWPFFYQPGSQLLSVGVEEYTLPVDCESVDWKSFRLRKNDTLLIQTTPLMYLSRDEWFERYRPSDEDVGTDGRGAPQFVFNSDYGASTSFGLTPSPDQAYTVDFQYYKFITSLDLYDDECIIPDRYNHVILDTALKYFYAFKDNLEQTSLWESRSEKAISRMKQNLIDPVDNMRSSVMNFGGPNWRAGFDNF